MAKSSKKSKKSRNIDGSIFENKPMNYVEAKAFQFIQKFIKNIDAKTETAFLACDLLESGTGIEAIDDALNPIILNFPKEKTAFVKEQDEKIKLLKAELKKLDIDLRKKGTTLDQLTPDEKGEVLIEATTPEDLEYMKEHVGVANSLRAEIVRIGKYLDYDFRYEYDNNESEKLEARPEDWKYLEDLVGKEAKICFEDSDPVLFKNLQALNDDLAIDENEKKFVELMFSAAQIPWFGNLTGILGGNSLRGITAVWSKILDIDVNLLKQMISKDSSLVKKGIASMIASIDETGKITETFSLNNTIFNSLMSDKNKTLEDVKKDILGTPIVSELDWDKDFTHLGDAGELILNTVSDAVKNKSKGINVLFHGAPGLGKTEAAVTLANKLNVPIYKIGGEDDANLNSEQLMQKLKVMQSLLAGTNAIVLLDEFSDFLPGSAVVVNTEADSRSKNMSSDLGKDVIHKMLEEANVVTIFTENNVDKFHPSILDRMIAPLEFLLPPVLDQEKMWKNINRMNKKRSIKSKFNLSAANCKDLSRSFSVPARLMTQAITTAKSMKNVRTIIREAGKRSFRNSRVYDLNNKLPVKYDLSLINAKVEGRDLSAADLSKGLVEKAKDTAFSMCVYGPSGSGKSAYAVNLANSMGKKAVHISSEILNSPYTEAKSKLEAFVYKLPDDVMLVIEDDDKNEACGKISNQMIATINGMLENKTGNILSELGVPVLLLTDKVTKEGIKPENNSNFNYTVKFDYADEVTARKSFKKMFGRKAPKSLQAIKKLTVGDIMTTHKKLEAEIAPVKPLGIVRMIQKEVTMRNTPREVMGFKS